MRVKNWITCIQDPGEFKDVIEKDITFKHYRSSTPEEEEE